MERRILVDHAETRLRNYERIMRDSIAVHQEALKRSPHEAKVIKNNIQSFQKHLDILLEAKRLKSIHLLESLHFLPDALLEALEEQWNEDALPDWDCNTPPEKY